jgi:alkylation response protein AidB-like acyl-CoA dehydrogenase
VVDAAIQIHGAAGVCDDYGLTGLFAYARALRIADGPDEVHRALIARLELRAQAAAAGIEMGKGR